ncbi:putative ribonuclease H protein [Acorus calamus]|uniref:Ribonuclease H protein n=1 Tax=Acorus calamus TaxID=4465 RepID=A0AAV9EIQ8_ACOCL|nr:putative ribonuclease H protein [Acorus calamus]
MNGPLIEVSLWPLDVTFATNIQKMTTTSSLAARPPHLFGTNLRPGPTPHPHGNSPLLLPLNNGMLPSTCLEKGELSVKNDAKFNGNPPNIPHIINNIRKSMHDAFSIHGSKWKLDPQLTRLVNSLGIPSSPSPPTPPIEVKWIKPKPPWIKCNTDGASKGNPGPSGAGGLFRDHNGRFLLGFACNTKRNTNMFAEFYALHRGLMIWLDTHPHFTGPLWIESDSLVVVNTILEKTTATPRIKHLVDIIHPYLRTLSLWHISHVFREGNRVADKLANLAIVEPTEAIWNSPPASIIPFLNDDANEVPQHRFPKGS